jgi:membrane protein required for colicin V production
MTLDLIVLAVVVVAGLLGAIAGAARQIAQLIALVVAYFCARPFGTFLGPKFAAAAHAPQLFGLIAMTLAAFIGVMIAVRYVLTRFFRGLLAGRDKDNRGPDRALGFILGAAKVLLIAYVMLSGLSFVEDHVEVAGKRMGISPRDSLSMQLARRYNLFDLTVFSPVRDLIAISRELQEPGGAERLAQSPAYRSLMHDPRFMHVFSDKATQRALRLGDAHALLRDNAVLALVQDRDAAARLAAALSAGQ